MNMKDVANELMRLAVKIEGEASNPNPSLHRTGNVYRYGDNRYFMLVAMPGVSEFVLIDLKYGSVAHRFASIRKDDILSSYTYIGNGLYHCPHRFTHGDGAVFQINSR